MATDTSLQNLYAQRPEYKDKSLNEIERMMIELEIIKADKLKEAEAKKEKELHDKIAKARVEYDEEFERRKESWLDDFKWFLRYDLVKPEAVEAATSANGAVVLTNLLKRGFPADFIPPGLAEELGGITVKASGKKRAGGEVLKDKAPEKGEGGETPKEIVERVVKEAKNPLTKAEILTAVSRDKTFGDYLRNEPKGFNGVIAVSGRLGLIKKTEDGKYTKP